MCVTSGLGLLWSGHTSTNFPFPYTAINKALHQGWWTTEGMTLSA